MKRLVVLMAALLASSLPALAAGIVVPAEQRYIPFSGDIPQCNDPDYIKWIELRVANTEATFWNSSLEIVSIDDVRQIGMRSNGVQYLPRRYCTARAHMSDLKTRTVVYQIQERTGFAGYDDSVEWCVVGLDRNLAYMPACSILKPLVDRYAHDQIRFPPPPGQIRGSNAIGDVSIP
jgi:hypothetical protein